MENAEITLDSLIKEGHNIKNGLKKVESPFAFYWDFADKSAYEIWKNYVSRFLATNYPNDFQLKELNTAISKFEGYYNPKDLLAIIGILEGYKSFPSVVTLSNDGSKNIGTQVNITNSNSQTQSQQQSVEIFIKAIEYDLPPRKIDELKEIVAEESGDLEKAKPKILNKIMSWGGDVAAGIVTNLITNPAIWGGM